MKIEKICTGCGRSSLKPVSEQHVACCPDNNYVEMSNNKQMKLYTEEQVRQSLMKHQNASMLLSSEQIDYLIEEITPIELPSDEEICVQFENYSENWEIRHALQVGAKWMRDKIQGGNNE